jgi:hypothetical protein
LSFRPAILALSLLALGCFMAQAHQEVIRHKPHEAESRKAHDAVKRKPHEAASHPKAQKAPKHETAQHQKPTKVSKH